MKKIFLPLLALVALASCTQNDMDLKGSDEQAEIKLSTVVGSVVQSRASYDETVPGTNSKDLDAKVLITKNPGNYSTLYNTASDRIVFSAASEFGFVDVTDGTTKAPVYYPADDYEVSISGLYPYSTTWTVAWDASASKTYAVASITGEHDLMVAKEVVSKKSSITATSPAYPKLDFNHMLTKLIVKVKGDADAATTFGKITTIELAGVQVESTALSPNIKSKVKTSLEGTPVITYTDPVETLPFFVIDATVGQTTTSFANLADANALAIPETATDVAYSMVPPIESIAGGNTDKIAYILRVKTKEGGAEGFLVKVKLYNADGSDYDYTAASTVSKTFTITLTFKATEITPVAGVGVWEQKGNSDIDIQ